MVEMTFIRAVKVWWSFMWRAGILTMPVAFMLLPVMFWIMPIPKPGEPPRPIQPDQMPEFFGKFGVIWLVMMFVMIGLQALAIKWMLKTKWSDFRLMVVPPDEGKPEVSKVE